MRLAVYMLGQEDDARDAVQEVFARLWERGAHPSDARAFILRSVRNACLDRLAAMDRRERMRRQLSLEAEEDMDSAEERARLVREAVDELLTPAEREVVDIIYARRLSYREAAAALGVSVAAINKRVVTALRKLRNHLNVTKR